MLTKMCAVETGSEVTVAVEMVAVATAAEATVEAG